MDPLTRKERLAASWWHEIEAFCPESSDYNILDGAELPDELARYTILEDEQEEFWTLAAEWHEFLLEHEIWLPLEQSCNQGLLLPMETRLMRLITCPEPLLRHLRWFFELCPEHVKHPLAYDNYLLVRLERARRTGGPEWRPVEFTEPDGPVRLFQHGSRARQQGYTR